MNYVEYDHTMSTTKIIKSIEDRCEKSSENRYTRENILESEKLYGDGFQSPGKTSILDIALPEKKFKSILEIGCGLGEIVIF